MPVSCMAVREGAYESLESKTSRNHWIIVDIDVIVEIDEIVPEGLAKDRPSNCDQEKRQIEDATSQVFLPCTGSARGSVFPSAGTASRRTTMNTPRRTHTELSEGANGFAATARDSN